LQGLFIVWSLESGIFYIFKSVYNESEGETQCKLCVTVVNEISIIIY